MKLHASFAALCFSLSLPAIAGFQPYELKTDLLQARLTQNQNEFYAVSHWFDRIYFSGLLQSYAMIEGDAMYSKRGGNNVGTRFNGLFSGNGNTSTDLWLSRANFYIDADVNDWTQVHMAFDFSNFANIVRVPGTGVRLGGTASHMYMYYDERSYLGSNTNLFPTPDEATILMGNFTQTPFYLRAGREYLRFGNYERNVTPITLTQMTSQTLADAVEVGFVDIAGFNGSIAGFRSATRARSRSTNINNFVAQLGYAYEQSDCSMDLSVDYMYDITAVNFLGAPGVNLGIANTSSGPSIFPTTEKDRVGGIVATAIFDWREFALLGQVFLQEEPFTLATLSFNGKPASMKAWLVQAGYNFGLLRAEDTKLAINYQMTHEALGVGLPKYRIQGTLTHEFARNAFASVAMIYDHDYKTSDRATFPRRAGGTRTVAGTGNDSFTGVFGVTVRIV